jgi:hypothetical protein
MAVNINEIFAGDEYKTTRAMMSILKRDFPQDYAGLLNQEERLLEWKARIDSGSRSDDQTRDDIAQYVIGEEALMEKYGISAEEAQQVILGGNEGGINFGDLAAAVPAEATGGVELARGVPAEEEQDLVGVGGAGQDEATRLTILTGKEMKWYFDKGSGKWFVEYGLPNSDRTMVFEAEPDKMDALFGSGLRPTDYEETSLSALTQRAGVTFAGNISEMAGTGTFEGEVARVTALALDEGVLPEWALKDGVAMDILYTAQSEGKGTEWTLTQLSKTQGFKERFPSISQFRDDNNLSIAEAVSGFLEMETGVNQALKATGQEGSVTPEQVGALLSAGHSLKTVQTTVTGFKRMEDFAPALDAFNQILAANDQAPITEIQDMLDFVSGRSSSAIYDLYEASSIQEAAVGAGLGEVFSAQDAIRIAAATQQTLGTATQGMQQAANLLLRLRAEVDMGKFGLDHEELISISLGETPRSGRAQSEIQESINRAVASAQGTLQARAKPHVSFGQTGTPQSASLRNLRQPS